MYTRKKYAKISTLLLLTLLLTQFTACTPQNQSADEAVNYSNFFFDTYITITLYEDNAAMIDKCFKQCAYYESIFSKTVSGSDIDRINQADGHFVSVTDDTIILLNEALQYAELTNGAIDPTINAVTCLWDFSDSTSSSLPSTDSIGEALSHVDYQAIIISGNQVALTDSEASLDLGFIAKGYIADRIKETLQNGGITHAIINLGGNVQLLGTKPDNSNYSVAIKRPFHEEENIAAISVSDCSIVTSGVYERYFYVDDQLYHHILDTTTGYPIDNHLTSVTIVCDSSLTADALSTTCFVLGLDAGLQLIESMDGVEVMFVDDREQITTSSGFPENLLTTS